VIIRVPQSRSSNGRQALHLLGIGGSPSGKGGVFLKAEQTATETYQCDVLSATDAAS